MTEVDHSSPRVLILGAYGLIGSEIVAACLARGWQVSGLGRDPTQMLAPIRWITADLGTLTRRDDWAPLLADVDVVINAAGALQDGPSGRVSMVHDQAIAALALAARPAGVRRIVQISAVGALPGASTEFLSTKAAGDAAIRAAQVEHVILRPGLVLGRSVYGGSALLRMLAAVPWVQPVAFGDARIQVIGMDALTRAVLQASDGTLPPGAECDLVADTPVTLEDLLNATRAWLGFASARAILRLPSGLARLAGRLADGLAWLGWRSPLRTTALVALAEGVTGDPAPWRKLTGQGVPGLDAILAAQPATLQDRWHARMSLLLPVILVTLSMFWLASGLVGLARQDMAAAVLDGTALSPFWAKSAVLGGAAADISLGLLVLYRPWAGHACLGMILVSLLYLVGGTILVPQLWLDPLGPLVKVFPSLVLALALIPLLRSR